MTAQGEEGTGADKNAPLRRWSLQLPLDELSNNSDEEEANARPMTEAERNFQNSSQVPIYKFVLTGGPCGGKTTGLARIYSFLRERGKLLKKNQTSNSGVLN